MTVLFSDPDEQEYADANGTAWCLICHRYSAVADSYETDTGDTYSRVYSFTARPLFCGHDDNGPERDEGPASDATAGRLALEQEATRLRLDRAAHGWGWD